MCPLPMDDEFMGMDDYIVESFHDLLMGDSESPSDSDSSRGSHHPLRECFMVGTPDGRVESVHEGGATPLNDFDDEVKEDAGPFPACRRNSKGTALGAQRCMPLARAGARRAQT